MAKVIPIPANNPGRNLSYLVFDPRNRNGVLIDPIASEACLRLVRELGVSVDAVINTHEHRDHTGGNAAIREALGAPIFAWQHAHIENALPINEDTTFALGGAEADMLTVRFTPGHTPHHICLAARDENGGRFWLTGDTFFAAGVGNCINGGNEEELYRTVRDFVFGQSDVIYPGHDYLRRNLEFTLAIEPENDAAQTALANAADNFVPTTFAQEAQYNCFFRLSETSVREGIVRRQHALGFAELADNATPREVFLALRSLRNVW